MPDHLRRRRGGRRELGFLEQPHVGQPARPAQQRAGPAGPDQHEVVDEQQLGDRLVVARGRRVLQGLDDQSSVPQPGASPSMDLGCRLAIGVVELELGELGDQRMDAVPLAVLEAGDEQERVLELGQERSGVRALEQLVAQRGREPAEHRGLEQERAQLVAKRPERDLAEVVGDEPVVGAELADCLTRVLVAAKPHPGEQQRRRPALGPVHQRLDIVGGEVEATVVDEQPAGLVGGEGQLSRTHFGQPTARSQSREAELGVGARHGDQSRVRRKPVQRVGQRAQTASAGQRVQVVEHDDQRLRVGGELVHQRIDRRFDRPSGHRRRLDAGAPGAGGRAGNRRRHVGPQSGRGRCRPRRGSATRRGHPATRTTIGRPSSCHSPAERRSVSTLPTGRRPAPG